jgi:hypothetical protein
VSLIPSGTVVTVETKYFPPLVIDLSPEPVGTPPGLGGIVTSKLKPKVTISLQGRVLARVAPYGEPTPNQWNKVKIGLAVAAALAVFSILRILR